MTGKFKPFHSKTELSANLVAAHSQVNPCEECTECCKIPAITQDMITRYEYDALKFRPKKPCVDCEKLVNEKCSIYKNRPGICRQFVCAYAIGMLENRPDATGVVWGQQVSPSQTLFVGQCRDIDEALKDQANLDDILTGLNSGQYDHVVIRDTKVALAINATTGETFEADVNEDGSIDGDSERPGRFTLEPNPNHETE